MRLTIASGSGLALFTVGSGCLYEPSGNMTGSTDQAASTSTATPSTSAEPTSTSSTTAATEPAPGSSTGTSGSTSSSVTSSTGLLATCGDGVVQGDEECDDGDQDERDECTSLCRAPSCDDGLVSGDEIELDCGGSCAPCPCDVRYQHRWSSELDIPGGDWIPIPAAQFTMTTTGVPLEIELSIPLLGGNTVTMCRPTIDGAWAGTFQGLFEHPGIEGYERSVSHRRVYRRTRVYHDIPAGEHKLGVQCRSNEGSATVGHEGTTSLVIAHEYTGNNRVRQTVVQPDVFDKPPSDIDLAKLPGSDLVLDTTQSRIEVTISLSMAEGFGSGCLEFMEDKRIPSTPAYGQAPYDGGYHISDAGRSMWWHTRTYDNIPPNTHTFSIHCWSNGQTLILGTGVDKMGPEGGSVIIVREFDEAACPSQQKLVPFDDQVEIAGGPPSTWTPLPAYSTMVDVVHGNLEITEYLVFEGVKAGAYFTCRPTVANNWAGKYAGLDFTSNETEGATRQNSLADTGQGLWTRRRLYTDIPPGTHEVGLECLSDAAGWSVRHERGVGSLLVRDLPLVHDEDE